MRHIILVCVSVMLLCLTGPSESSAALISPIPSSSAQAGLEHALELDQRLDASLRELALDAGRTISFTLAAGRGLRTEVLEKLLATYEAALKREPGNPLAAAGKARVLMALNHTQQAIAAFKEALRLDPGNQRLANELAELELSQAPRFRASLSYTRQREFWPWYNRNIYQTHETTYQTQIEAPVADGLRMGVGYLMGSLRQESLVYGDDDFNLNRRGYFILADWKPGPEYQVNMRLRRELFSANNDSSYFKMPDDEQLITGHFLLQHISGPWWANLSFSRERDTWPQVNPILGRGVLSVEAQELAGLAIGRAMAMNWEVGASVFYEMYGSPRPDQFNWNLQVTHRPWWLQGLRLSAGAAYYDHEYEGLLNFMMGYQTKLGDNVALDLSHQFEYSRNEQSWLSQFDIMLSWRPFSWVGFNILGSYGKEYQDDLDEYLSFEIGVTMHW